MATRPSIDPMGSAPGMGITGISPAAVTAELCQLRGDFRSVLNALQKMLTQLEQISEKSDRLLAQNEEIEEAVKASGESIRESLEPLRATTEAVARLPGSIDRAVEALEGFRGRIEES